MDIKKRKIYTMTMARHLIDNGFEPIETVPDRRNIRHDTWVFEATPEFNKACEDYVAKSKAKQQLATPEHDVDDAELSGLYLLGGQSIENIAKVHGVSIQRVLDAIRNDKRVQGAFAYALMTGRERKEVDALPQADREARLEDKLTKTNYEVSYNGADYPYRTNGLHWQE